METPNQPIKICKLPVIKHQKKQLVINQIELNGIKRNLNWNFKQVTNGISRKCPDAPSKDNLIKLHINPNEIDEISIGLFLDKVWTNSDFETPTKTNVFPIIPYAPIKSFNSYNLNNYNQINKRLFS